jgi:universal stress protein A
MFPWKKILCPADFSDPSFEAMDAAAELARHFSSELLVIHVVTLIPALATGHISSSAFTVHDLQQQLEKSSKKILEEHIEKRIPKGVSKRGMLLAGDPASRIVDTAIDETVDLIVIATRGQTGLKRIVFGSVAEKVVRLAGAPVLTIGGAQTGS